MRILHVVTRAQFDSAGEELRVSTRGATLDDVGFIHACTAEQLPGVLDRFYSDVEEPLVGLAVEEADLDAAGSPVRWEPAPGTGELFPHIYGPIPMAIVHDVQEISTKGPGCPER